MNALSQETISRPSRLIRDERGQNVVELAVVLPFVLLLLLGIMDFGKAFNYWITESQVTSDTVRHVVVTSSLTNADLKSYAQSDISIKELQDNAQICVSFPTGPTGTTKQIGDPVTVTIKYDYVWLPFLERFGGLSKFTLQRSATMRLEQATPNLTNQCPI